MRAEDLLPPDRLLDRLPPDLLLFDRLPLERLRVDLLPLDLLRVDLLPPDRLPPDLLLFDRLPLEPLPPERLRVELLPPDLLLARFGSFLRSTLAMSSSFDSLIDSYMSLDAPRSSDFFVSPRLALRAAPAAFCCCFDFAGIAGTSVGGEWCRAGVTRAAA